VGELLIGCSGSAKEFTLSIVHCRSEIISFPKPLAELLSRLDKITFRIEGKRVIMKA